MTHSNPLKLLGVSDAEALQDFDVLARVAAMVTGLPDASISFADDAYLWTAASTTTYGEKMDRENTFCSLMLSGDSDELVTSNVHHDPRTSAVAARRHGASITTYAGVQLKNENGEKVGSLCVTGDMERELDAEQRALLRGLARQAMNLVSLRAAKRQLTDSLQSMTKLATTDGLTGMLTRRAFHDEVNDLGKLVLRQGGEMCLVVVDIDHFKKINDTFGHATGDAVLKEVAEAIQQELRSTDRVGRIGGEEFGIAMPFTRLEMGLERIDKLRQSISQLSVRSGGHFVRVTISGGVADWRAKETKLDAPLARADDALYQAKSAGRNQIKIATAEFSPASMDKNTLHELISNDSLTFEKASGGKKGASCIAGRWPRAVAGVGLMAIALPSMARELVVCVPENPMPPFVYSERESEVQALVRKAVELQGDSVQFVRVPWKRCRQGLQFGTYMAAMPMAPNPHDLQDFSFPHKYGNVDEGLRLGNLEIGVVARKDSSVDWDGKSFKGLTSPVLVLPTQQLARTKLSELNVDEDAQAARASSLLNMLIARRRDAAVLPTTMLEEALATREFSSSLKLFTHPLTMAPVFLSFNKAFEQSHPGYTQSVWDSFARLRPKKFEVVTSRRSRDVSNSAAKFVTRVSSNSSP